MDAQPVDTGCPHRVVGTALKSNLHRGEQVVHVVGEENVDAHRHDRRQQENPDDRPHRHALSAGEIARRDAPELTSPLGHAADENQDDEQTYRRDDERLQNPDRGVAEFLAPIDGRLEL